MADVIDVRIVPARRTVMALGIAAGLTVGLVILQRKLSGPDSLTFVKMRLLAEVQEIADGQARMWLDVSDRAGRLYLSSHP
jgi:hypothetical protein